MVQYVQTRPSPYDAVVFSGGGCRCFWQAGFWATAAPQIGLAPDVIGAVSAGAAFACAALTGRTEEVVTSFARRAAANPRNFYPRNLLLDEPAFPHEAIYRGVIRDHLDASTLECLRNGPDVRVLLARPPERMAHRPWAAVASAAAAHVLNRRFRRVHAIWGDRLGFQREIVSIRSCETVESLVDLILHTSCAPPFVPLYRRERRIVLDGGLLDNAPVEIVGPARQTLVLLNHSFPASAIPRVPGRTYVRPSRPVPIHEWDYTSPAATRATYDLGRRDGDAFVAWFRRCTAPASPPRSVEPYSTSLAGRHPTGATATAAIEFDPMGTSLLT